MDISVDDIHIEQEDEDTSTRNWSESGGIGAASRVGVGTNHRPALGASPAGVGMSPGVPGDLRAGGAEDAHEGRGRIAPGPPLCVHGARFVSGAQARAVRTCPSRRRPRRAARRSRQRRAAAQARADRAQHDRDDRAANTDQAIVVSES